jgi:lysophospholipase L1-like esterase
MGARTLLGTAAACSVALAALFTAATAAPADAATGAGSYVALGDSYTAGPLISPSDAGAPALCLRSTANYPHDTATALGLSLTDASCSGATVSDMTSSQYAWTAPQFNALSANTSVVSLGIGGNDNNTFITAVAGCAALGSLDPINIGAPCKAAFGSRFTDAITSDGPNIAAALQRIHQLAPHAQVFVVGYPDILPHSGNCWLQLPITTQDVAYLDGVERALDTMLRSEAAANNATYVDTYTPSVGHDACRPESTRWVEPLIPATDALTVHPNRAGESAMASALESAIRAAS